jgi:hypothetical protein
MKDYTTHAFDLDAEEDAFGMPYREWFDGYPEEIRRLEDGSIEVHGFDGRKETGVIGGIRANGEVWGQIAPKAPNYRDEWAYLQYVRETGAAGGRIPQDVREELRLLNDA